MAELSNIFGELVRMLKDLPPGGFDKAYSLKTPSAAASRPVSFMCDKHTFKEVVRLAEMGERLAGQAHKPEAVIRDPFMDTVMAGFKSLEARIAQLSLDTATIAAAQPAPKSYSEAAASGNRLINPTAKAKTGVKGKKPPSAPTPPKAPRITLSHLSVEKDNYVELESDAGSLASRATAAIKAALREQACINGTLPPPFAIRGITRNNFTGDIQLHLDSMASLEAILSLKSDIWVDDVHPNLGPKRKTYPIIIHGMPTSFNPHNRVHVHDFLEDNHGVLDSSIRLVWANKYSIESGKPFSSLIVHLTDPLAANAAIRNRICFKHMLKVTERSTKRIRQCYKCLDYDHFAKTCTEDFRSCFHCAGAHPFESCPKRAEPLCCVNCAQKFLEASLPGVSTATTSDLTSEQRKSCTHSPFSNSCPLRRTHLAAKDKISDYFEVETNE